MWSNLNFAQLLDSLGWALLHSLWQGALAFGFIFFFRKFSKNSAPSLRYTVQFATLLACLAAFFVTFALAYNSAIGGSVLSASSPTAGLREIILSPAGVSSMPNAGWSAFGSDIGRYAPVLGLFWCVGFLFMAMRYGVAYHLTQKMRRHGLQDIPANWQRKFRTLVRNSGVSDGVKLYLSPYVSGPMTIGFFRPVILVPMAFLTQLPQEQVEAILLHELAHIRRYDYAINLVQTAIKTILFFHPAVHYISDAIDRDREQACDDLAVAQTRNPHALAKGLAALRLARCPSLAMAADNGATPLLDRLQRLTGMKPQGGGAQARRMESAVMLTLTAFLTGGLMLAFTPMADAHPTPTPKPKPVETYEHAKTYKHNYRFETANIKGREITVKITEDGARWAMADNQWVNVDKNPDIVSRISALPVPPIAPKLPQDCQSCAETKMDQFQIDMEYFQASVAHQFGGSNAEKYAHHPDKSEESRRSSEAAREAAMDQAEDMREAAMERAEDQREAAMERAEDLREAAMERDEDLREAAMERAEDQHEAAMERAEDQREKAQEKAERAREKAEHQREKAQEKAERAQEKAEEARKEAKHREYHHAKFKTELTKMLIKDGVINSANDPIKITYSSNQQIINGVAVSSKFGDKYCDLFSKHHIKKSDQSSITITPERYEIIEAKTKSDQGYRVTYGTWTDDQDLPDAVTIGYQETAVPSFQMPVTGAKVTAEFGAKSKQWSKSHQGIDLAAPFGAPIMASADGVVHLVTTEPKWGNRVIIKHADGYMSFYGHMNGFNVTRGQSVKAGDVIGGVGSTGQSTGPHLHFEIRKDGQQFNPKPLIF